MNAVPALALILMLSGTRLDQEPRAPTFKAGVDMVTMSVVVNHRNGRPVEGLSSADFELLDAGQPRVPTGFRFEAAPITLAVLLDASGSMGIGLKWQTARGAIGQIAGAFEPGVDRAALFTFDTALHEILPFTTRPMELTEQFASITPFGSTAIFDAIAQTGRRLAALGGSRSAVVVVTDGVDNHSRLTAVQVAAVAAAIDMPVYVLIADPSLDRADTARDASLDGLARETGGAFFVAGSPVQTAAAVRQLVTELRHQYSMTFESSPPAGWHPLSVRVHGFVVRTRSGYMAGPYASDGR